ncbi:MAG: hypothetical protein ACXVXT_18050 [Blastococcus sp.]
MATEATAARPVRPSPEPGRRHHTGYFWDLELCGWRRFPSPAAAVPQVPTPRSASA